MRNRLPSRFLLLLLLVAIPALANDREKLAIRTLLLSEHPNDFTHRIYVKGQVVTVLRFEQSCDPSKTKLLGWKGRFEPPLVAAEWWSSSRAGTWPLTRGSPSS